MDKKKLFCSSCRHSRYVLVKGERKLHCDVLEAFGQRPNLPTDCRNAEDCLEYDRERWRDSLTDRRDYLRKMRKCKIPLFLEKEGVLRREKLA